MVVIINSKLTRRLLSLILAVAMFFFIITFSISLPIFCRGFYYAHIDALDLHEISGFTAQQIRTSYDAVLDYLTLPNKEFSAGDMAYTNAGAQHFADVKALVSLNTCLLIGSAVCVVALLVFRFLGKIDALRLGRHSAAFYSGVAAIILPLGLGLLVAIDFDTAFVIFHKIFFPGKDNWLFDPSTDQIIQVLPESFFMNCALLIASSVVLISLTFIISDFIMQKKKNQVDFK